MLALHGFDACGLEISSTAVATAERYAASQMEKPSSYNFAVSVNEANVSPGEVSFIEGDYFSEDWLAKIEWNGKSFDVIYDYTVRFDSSSTGRP
jgi:hypothetical protein